MYINTLHVCLVPVTVKKWGLVLATGVINNCKVSVGAGTQTLVLWITELCSKSSPSTSGVSPSEMPISWRQTLCRKAMRDAVTRDAHLMETPYLAEQ